jgi:hypothetical protein
MPARAASQCCRATTDGDTATLAATPSLRPPVAACAALPPLSLAGIRVAAPAALEPPPHARGAPIFLLTRSLRI